ncbi:MAG: SHOCT domain-containing protein [Anaerolineales bacterium]|nr:SHOCT domain-containing protein [Anaerolineales bacterium]
MMMGFGWIGLVIMFLFWGLLIAGAIFLMKSIFPGVGSVGGHYGDSQLSPREILDQRYARGEVTREQYLEMVKDLRELGNR